MPLRGQGLFEPAVMIITLFVVAVIGFAFIGPLGNAAHVQDANGGTINLSNITGATATLAYLSPTLGTLIIIGVLLAGAGMAFLFKGS